jgi:hypothetical protein
MEKVQNLKSGNTAPSSKTFRDEQFLHYSLTYSEAGHSVNAAQCYRNLKAAPFNWKNPPCCGKM